MSFATCDLCDANEDKIAAGTLSVLPPVFQRFGKETASSGPAATLKGFEDNVLARSALETAGKGAETGQQVGDTHHPFDDRRVAAEELESVWS